MSRVFVCYSRQNEAIVRALVDDLEALGHHVWFDRELTGGQAWWDQILSNVRDSEILVLALAPESLDSIACRREYDYAGELGKPILPVLVAEGVSTSLLPPVLSAIHFVDYRKQDRAAALRVGKAVNTLPPAQPLPEPLPSAPELPVSYLGGLRERIQGAADLGFAEQSALLVDLKRSLREPETAHDGRTLLGILRKRRDAFAAIAEEIDRILADTTEAPDPTYRTREARPSDLMESLEVQTAATALEMLRAYRLGLYVTRQMMKRPLKRLMGALAGAVIGTVIGLLFVILVGASGEELFLALGAPVAGGAVAGAISVTHRLSIAAALIGGPAGWMAVTAVYLAGGAVTQEEAFGIGLVLGVPLGAILGAIVGARIGKRRASGTPTQPTVKPPNGGGV